MSIDLPGIDPEEALGTPTVVFTGRLPGIDSEEALGTLRASISLGIPGIDTEEAVGYPHAVFTYTGDGGVEVGGGSTSKFRIYIEQDFLWHFRDTVSFDNEILWNTGQQALHWYRVQGCCENLNGGSSFGGSGAKPVCDVVNFAHDDAGCTGLQQQFIQNLIASDLHDLCAQLEKGKLKWEICSIKKYSQPVNGPTDDCNTLIEIPFRDIPECIPLSLTTARVNIGVHVRAIEVIYHYEGTGGVVTGGAAVTEIIGEDQPTTASYSYVPTGPAVQIGGSAESWSSWDSSPAVNMGMFVSVEGLEAVFATTSDGLPELTPITSTVVTQCGLCDSMPQILYMRHNLTANGGVLVDFLQRNGFKLPSVLPMYYSRRLQSWLATYHFTGIGSDNRDSDENWRFSFEWACSDQIAGDDLSSSAWKFSMFVGRSNPNNTDNSDTRLLIVFPPDQICAATQNFGFELPFKFNTVAQHVKTNLDMVINRLVYSDKVGLFKSSGWVKNPEFRISLSKSNTDVGVKYQDIYPIFPPQPLTIR